MRSTVLSLLLLYLPMILIPKARPSIVATSLLWGQRLETKRTANVCTGVGALVLDKSVSSLGCFTDPRTYENVHGEVQTDVTRNCLHRV